MAISRPFLLALLGALLLGATFYAVQSARNTATDDAAPVAQQPAEQPPEQPAPSEPAGLTAEEALAAAFAGDQKVESGRFSVRLGAEDFRGVPQLNGASIEVGGRFQGNGTDKMPEFDIDMKIAAAGERLQVGAISLGDRGYVTRGERAYLVPDAVMPALVEARSEIKDRYAGEPQPKLSVSGFDVGGWLTAPKVAGTETIDGVEVTHVEATLDPSRFADGIVQLSGQGSDIPEGEFLKQAAKNRATLERSLGKPEVDVYVGEDRILRRLSVQAELDVPAGGQRLRGDVVLEYRLSEVNEPQQITAPKTTSNESLQKAFNRTDALNSSNMLALGALMIQQPGLAGARADNFNFAELTGGGVLTENPERAAKAIKAHKKVVIFFHNPEGLDDRAMTNVVRGVAARTQAVVLTDHVDAVDRYGKMVEDLGVSQTPSVVLVDRTGDARLIEGYVDTETLAQAVADAR